MSAAVGKQQKQIFEFDELIGVALRIGDLLVESSSPLWTFEDNLFGKTSEKLVFSFISLCPPHDAG